MSDNKKEKACSDQFYFQNAVFTEKEPDEDQDDKDYVDIWLKWSNCTNKYIYVSIIGCDLHGSQFACQRNFTFCFLQRRRPLILTSSLWSAVQSVAKAGSRHKRELVTSPVISTSTDTNFLVHSLVHLLVHLPIHLAVHPLVHLLHHTQHQNQLRLLQIKQSWSIWNG